MTTRRVNKRSAFPPPPALTEDVLRHATRTELRVWHKAITKLLAAPDLELVTHEHLKSTRVRIRAEHERRAAATHQEKAGPASGSARRGLDIRKAEAAALAHQAQSERSQFGSGLKLGQFDDLYARSAPSVSGGSPGSSKRR